MAYYTALITAWNGTPTPPAGVTGTSLSGLTTANKIIAVNAWTVPAAKPAIIPVTSIINAILPADFTALTALQLQEMQFLLQGNGSVNASPGTTIRAVFQSIFAGKAATLANLSALVTPFDNATALWWAAPVTPGPGAGLTSPVSSNDLVAAGGLA